MYVYVVIDVAAPHSKDNCLIHQCESLRLSIHTSVASYLTLATITHILQLCSV